ncbi:MAG: succinyl-diaminopimelate desuccinylase [Nautiliaceae bacterium]
MKVYELKKGDKIIHKEEILEFEEIRGDKAIFINEYFEEKIFPDFLDIEEIGEFYELTSFKVSFNSPSLF